MKKPIKQPIQKIEVKKSHIIKEFLIVFTLILGSFVFFLIDWSIKTFAVTIDSIIFTLTTPLNEYDTSTYINSALLYIVPKLLLVLVFYVVLRIFVNHISENIMLSFSTKKSIKTYKLKDFIKKIISVLCIFTTPFSIIYANNTYHIFSYLFNKTQITKIYENYYIDPNTVNIQLNPESKSKNLIYIYLESMETTYMSYAEGGYNEINYIPELTELAQKNTFFSNTNKLGGFLNTSNTSTTIGALFATTSGIPYSYPINRNQASQFKNLTKPVTTLGDILSNFGYNQMFLCGSDANFFGRRNYFEDNGSYEIYDLFTARKNDIIPSDYHDGWWGYEDLYLYEIAKKEILKLSTKDKPFNFTMLTVDTHFPEGHTCKLCPSYHNSKTANIISCADTQINNFIDWCKNQEFYEDTLIVITGDHPRMDNFLIENADTRAIYNCWINCNNIEAKTTNRVFTPMDIFPTTLSQLGFIWSGNRLGLGTNLFSNQQTLAEEVGFDYLDTELSKNSHYFTEHFIYNP